MSEPPSESVNFDRAIAFYDQTRGFPPGAEGTAVQLIAQAGAMTPDTKAVEIGIGTGRIALPLARHVAAVSGADISGKMMRVLLEKREDQAVFPVQADARWLPYPDNAFDAGVIAHVLHLIPDPQAVLAELARVLKPDARLVHCHSRDDKTFSELMDAWQGPLKTQMRTRWQLVDASLPDADWKQIGPELAFDYTKHDSPEDLIELYRRRAWSATWLLSDEELRRGLEAMEAFVRERYDDPSAPIAVTHTFRAMAYTPPV
jgi:ubiquinone/menaquinone biosynthesis C-methylase UbiE